MNPTFLRWLLFGLLMLTTGVVHAEGGCPPGFQPSGAAPTPQDPVACRPISGYDQQQSQQRPPPQWEPRWGAIATDGPGGSFGASTNMPAQQSADNAAMADCRSKKGSSTCAVEIAYVNQCAAMVAGDTGHNTKAGLTIDLAIQAAMKICSAADTHCYAYYTGCSMPQRIQ